MSRFGRFIFAAAIIGAAYGTASLGRWQLRRLATRRAANAALLQARNRAPLRLPEEWRPGTTIDSGRRVVVRGHFDAAVQYLLRQRAQEDAPGLQVVNRFVIDNSAVSLWVLRGFVRSPDAVTPPAILTPDTALVTIEGIALAVPVVNDSGHPLIRGRDTTYQRLDQATLHRRDAAAIPVYLILAGDNTGPGRIATVAPAELSDGPHLSYAIQWFGITVAILVFGIIIVWRDGRASVPQREAP